ncbi:uncharacterized protein Z518_09107 [Rhinocladiella mackenziei CBS 650.93]|uniref:Xylanolytic transcriptional activator regulatory domain-containing protein n=1 Tax=Rhinocladiella mackenziei CBS 650.93 TaxID=1442369 RepID=A0A0D2FH79_9EURO|nr:uncharacterized protein Z518_09107 [Rhinocladiella mackenziei CBS 650.93]KIX01382.1 hypothetical protein Z518_09107 [Rhinocladiella mackenziei CBS 650.93]
MNKYQTLGEGDCEPRQVEVIGTGDISKVGSILLEFLSQDFDEGSIGDYQATFVDDYACVVRMLGPTFGKGFQPQVYHFRDAPFIKRENGSIPRVLNDGEHAVLRQYGSFVIPSSKIADGFIAAFFDRVHPTMPVLNRAEFYRTYLETSSSQPVKLPLLLLQAVILSGSTVWKHPDLNLPPDEVSWRLFVRAKALVEQRFEQDRLALVIAHLLFSTFTCDSCDDTNQNMWLSLGTAIRLAFGLGMHRDLGNANALPEHRRQWKITWWTLFLHDVLCSFEWGRPRAVNLDDSDVPELVERDLQPVEPGALSCVEHTEFFLQSIDLCFIISTWLDSLRPGGPAKRRASRNGRPNREEQTRRCCAELSNWYTNLSPAMRPPHSRRSHYSLWSGMLNMCYHAATLRFYSRDPDAKGKLHDAAVSISQICVDLCEQDLIDSIWVYGIHQLDLAMCQHARESRDDDPDVAEQGLQNLRTSLPILERLSTRSSTAKQGFIFLKEVAEGNVMRENLATPMHHHESTWDADMSRWHLQNMEYPGFEGYDGLSADLWTFHSFDLSDDT